MSLDRNIDQVIVRPFSPAEWEKYKSVRLKALQEDPQAYGSSYALEKPRSDREWQEKLASKDTGIFGVFSQNVVIGMIGVYTKSDEYPDTARIWGVWLEKDWRGRGLTKPMYAACLDWARRQPGITRAYVGHREGNEASRRMTLANGFESIGAEDHAWPDGKTELLHMYILKL